jgi:putative transposase
LHQTHLLYNAALQERCDAYKNCNRKSRTSITWCDQSRSLTQIRGEDPEFSVMHLKPQRGALRRLDRAFVAFFNRVKKGEKLGFPRFKSRDRWRSIELPEGYRLDNARLKTKDFSIKIHMHQPLPENFKKHCGAILVKDHKGWLVNFKIEIEEAPEKKPINSAVGLDVGLRALVATSDETSDRNVYDAPEYLRKAEKKLRRLQRALARCKKGSKRRQAAKQRVISLHDKVKNQRRDHAHKLAKDIVEQADFIAVENLKISNMVKNKHLAKSISDAGWASLTAKMEYKAESAGKYFVRVDPKNTSQQCSNCKQLVRKTLSNRVHKCDHCGLKLDRDVNAAKNILALGLQTHSDALGTQGAVAECHCQT